MKAHHYSVTVTWTGNTGTGTSAYRAYERSHEISADSTKAGGLKPIIPGSSDPNFRGDPARWNPEELLVASLSACHKLWYLHLCSVSGITVLDYVDHAEGIMEETPDGSGRFQSVTLHPKITIAAEGDIAKAHDLHAAAHAKCFIANSMNFPVHHEAEIKSA